MTTGTEDFYAEFKAEPLDPVTFAPVTYAWHLRVVRGVINNLVGDEKAGKGTLEAWMIARLTRGELPGHFWERPVRVLWIGDEDDPRHVLGPRLYAAGADFANVDILVPSLLNIGSEAGAGELDRLITSGPFEVVVFEQLLDNLPVMRNPYDPHEVRAALRELRVVLHRRETTALTTLHAPKQRGSDFRSRVGGSHQFNALARSGLLVTKHPAGNGRHVLVHGAANYSRLAATLSFAIKGHQFVLNGYEFDEPLACDFREEPDLDVDSILGGGAKTRRRDQVKAALIAAIRAAVKGLEDRIRGFTLAALAKLIGRKGTDGTVRTALGELVEEGVLRRGEDGRYYPTSTLFDEDEEGEREAAGASSNGDGPRDYDEEEAW
jgi:AAA domain